MFSKVCKFELIQFEQYFGIMDLNSDYRIFSFELQNLFFLTYEPSDSRTFGLMRCNRLWRSWLQRTGQLQTVLVFLRRYKLLRWSFVIYRVSLFAGIGIKNANTDSMFVVVDTSKCPTRLDSKGAMAHASSGYIVATQHTLCKQHE